MPRQRARALAVGTARGHLWDKNCWMLRICRGRDVGRGSAFASPTTYDVTTSAQELDDRYRPCQRVACPLSSRAQPGSHPSGPRHRSCGSAACSRTVGRGNALLRQRGALRHRRRVRSAGIRSGVGGFPDSLGGRAREARWDRPVVRAGPMPPCPLGSQEVAAMNRHLFDPFLYRALRKVARGEIGSTSEKGAAAPQRGPVAAHGQHAVRAVPGRAGQAGQRWRQPARRVDHGRAGPGCRPPARRLAAAADDGRTGPDMVTTDLCRRPKLGSRS
jgi:hypothetical protein